VEKAGNVGYHGSSLDEIALVEAAHEIGYELVSREANMVTVRIEGETREYRLLKNIEFDSDRKRMSSLLQSPESDYIVFTKGADSSMFPLFTPGNDDLKKKVTHDVHQFSSEGLRTLCFGMKMISE